MAVSCMCRDEKQVMGLDSGWKSELESQILEFPARVVLTVHMCGWRAVEDSVLNPGLTVQRMARGEARK
jgi:hypothetical protein